ncbi:MAG: DNA recombination/repair protein RecA, partial [Clostridia bacterium]|nr:DNA recombination/repair protein RecA [Clostridia bacterium]
ETEFDLIYGKGISRSGEMLDCAVKLGIVQKSGGWFSYGSERLGNGRENVKRMIENDEALAARLEKDLNDKLHGNEAAVEEVTRSSRQPKTVTETSANINISADDFEA